MAAPHVSGVAALLLSITPELNGKQLKDIIMRSAVIDPGGPLVGLCVSGGRLDASRAVGAITLLGKGTGKQHDPYRISNEYQFRAIPLFDSVSVTRHFRLENDIILPDFNKAWVTVPVFYGDLDGNRRTISGIEKSSNLSGMGLFAENRGTIRYLNVRGSMSSRGFFDHTGMIADINYGLIKECTTGSAGNSRMITLLLNLPNTYIGGIAGFNQGTIQCCTNYGDIFSGDNVGGIAGYNTGIITHSSNNGTINGTGNNIGGLVGHNQNGRVEISFNAGTITGAASYGQGGIVGTGDNVGGVIGANISGSATSNYNTGNVSGRYRVGGITGLNTSSGTVSGSYNIGNVTGHEQVGGITGWNGTLIGYSTTGTISNNVSIGKHVTGVTILDIARVSNSGILSNNRARTDMIVTASGRPVVITSNPNGIHGGSVPLGTLQTTVFTDFNPFHWSNPVGSLLVNGALPALLRMPQGIVQNPTLP
jgi:hypothetical protein